MGASRMSRCFVDTQAIGLAVAVFLVFVTWIPNTFSPIRLVGGRVQQPARAVEASGLGPVSSAPHGANPTGTEVISVQPCSGQEALIDV